MPAGEPSEPPGRVVIAGGTGFLGRSLANELTTLGYDVIVLARSTPRQGDAWRTVPWDGPTLGPWSAELDGAAGLVNLVGRTIDCVKTPDHCDEILRSRVESTRVLGEACRSVVTPPPAWVQMSTAHIYGDPPSAVCDEDSATGYGLAPTVGRAWEAAFDAAAPAGVRRVVLRTSFVIGRGGGALTRLAALARFGFGGRVGHGQQGMSWIHADDMNALFVRGLTDPAMQGVYVATAPNPVSNREFMRTLRRVMGVPVGLPAPAWLVRLGAPLVMRTDPELAIFGRYCVSRRLADEGFAFGYPLLDPALRSLLGKHPG